MRRIIKKQNVAPLFNPINEGLLKDEITQSLLQSRQSVVRRLESF